VTQKLKAKPYWEMTAEELAAATAEFDEEHVEDKFKPLSPKNRARWERISAKLAAEEDRNGERILAVHIDNKLLEQCTALAKKKRISRDALIARGLRAVLAAEGNE
jgi:hypothetical protein